MLMNKFVGYVFVSNKNGIVIGIENVLQIK